MSSYMAIFTLYCLTCFSFWNIVFIIFDRNRRIFRSLPILPKYQRRSRFQQCRIVIVFGKKNIKVKVVEPSSDCFRPFSALVTHAANHFAFSMNCGEPWAFPWLQARGYFCFPPQRKKITIREAIFIVGHVRGLSCDYGPELHPILIVCRCWR